MTANLTWPNDADGDVFRRLKESGFNFDVPYSIDFNIDFQSWPPSAEFIKLLLNKFKNVEVIEPDGKYSGYILFIVDAKLTYELVMFVQSSVSELASPFGGTCESWGVLHE